MERKNRIKKMQVGLTTWKDPEAASRAAAHFFVDACHRAIDDHGRFVVGLSGGSTPRSLYKLLASQAFNKNIPWQHVFLFWSDERYVPPTNKESNYLMVKQNLLASGMVPTRNIFPVRYKKTASESAASYEKMIRGFFKKDNPAMDWLLLGVGNDGHTASLFPGTEILKEKKRLVKEVWLEDKKSWRISFTYPMINAAKQIVFLVTGEEKAPIVEKVFLAKKTAQPLPAQLVDPVKGKKMWILDYAAASLI